MLNLMVCFPWGSVAAALWSAYFNAATGQPWR